MKNKTLAHPPRRRPGGHRVAQVGSPRPRLHARNQKKRYKRGYNLDMSDQPRTPDEKLQREFNRWAAEGEGDKMQRHHLDITEKTIRLMNLRPGERVLDLGCGSGWATRLLARMVGEGP